MERDRRRRADGDRDRPGSQRQVRSQHLPGEAEGDLRASGQQLARARQAGLVPGRPEAGRAARATSTCRGSATARFSKAPRARIFADFTTPRDHPEQRRRRPHLLQAPREGRAAAADRRHRASRRRPGAPRRRRPRRRRRRPARRPARRASRPCRAPTPGAERFPGDPVPGGQHPAALGLPNTDVEAILEAEKAGRAPRAAATSSSWSGSTPARARATTWSTARAARRTATSTTRAR